jgi:hypothetical protein
MIQQHGSTYPHVDHDFGVSNTILPLGNSDHWELCWA